MPTQAPEAPMPTVGPNPGTPARPGPATNAAATHVPLLHVPTPEMPMIGRRTRVIEHHERIIPGPNFPAQLVAAVINDAQQDERPHHQADVWCRMENTPSGPQLVVGFTQESVS